MISVTILVKNRADQIGAVLESLRPFSEVLVGDTGSTDQTVAIAQTFANTRVHSLPFEGFGPSHRRLSSLAKSPWILSIDSDEVLTPELAQEILSLELCTRCVYSITRENYHRNTHVYSCGWASDRVVRLYHRDMTSFSTDAVHERIIVKDLQQVSLHHVLLHTPLLTTRDALEKINHYSTLWAASRKEPTSPSQAFFHGLFAFMRSYFWLRGWMQGSVGFEISLYNGLHSYYKYLKRAYASDEKNLSR